MTNLDYGVFVTSVADGMEAEMLQVVVIKFSKEDRDQHFDHVNGVGKLMFGWLYEDDLLERGILQNLDFPDWITEDQRFILCSQYPLWAAWYLRIKNGRHGSGTSRLLQTS